MLVSLNLIPFFFFVIQIDNLSIDMINASKYILQINFLHSLNFFLIVEKDSLIVQCIMTILDLY